MRRRVREFGKVIENNSDMFKDYISAVVREYHDKVASNTISLNLSTLTPGNVKKECMALCKKGYRREDERVLSAVFGYAENANSYLKAIERYDIDKFRPMIKFVEGRIKETDARNVELLAWLIDFKDRPFDPNGKYGGITQSAGVNELQVGIDESPNLKNDLKSSPSAVTSIQPMLTPAENPIRSSERSRPKGKVLVVALIVALFGGAMAYLSLNNPTSRNKTSNNDSCMYWRDDHYERVSCGQKVQYAKVIALDPDLLNNFRRITIPDTITYNSIGKVWYIKIEGNPEFYTGMGYHPIFMQLQLKPITKYIIDKHILKKPVLKDTAARISQTTDTHTGQPNDFKLLSKRLKTSSSAIYGQCQAITKANTRCSRNAQRGGFCWQHMKRGS
jgi:hypothetical protein